MRTINATVLSLTITAAARGQTVSVTAADYARAEGRLGRALNSLVLRGAPRPTWVDSSRFWYRNQTADGAEFILVTPATRSRATAFDHARLATALGQAADTTISARDLPLSSVAAGPGALTLTFDLGSRRFSCDSGGMTCHADPSSARPAGPNTVVAPDGKQAAFIRAANLWVRNLGTGEEKQLTTDGQPEFGYATDNAGWTKSDNPVLVWSPDSKKIATFQHDSRGVGMMYLVSTAVGHPRLEAWKYPLPGDSAIFMISRVIIDVESARVTRLAMPPDPHRSTICDHVYCNGTWADVEWYPDSRMVAFVSSSRDHKDAVLRVADAATGTVREVMREHSATQFESGFGRVNWHILPATNEAIWFSERDDWGNLYLYDLTTGQLKQQITHGPGPVLELLRIDEKTRTLYFTATGKEPGQDPYFRHFYRIGLDGRNQQSLTPENGDHSVALAPDGLSFVDSWSTPTVPPTTVLRDLKGKVAVALEQADISRLLAAGWQAPIPFSTKARDGKTDLYGLMYRPSNFDSTRRYPVLNYLYPGPQSGSVGTRSFVTARMDKQAVAELGFVVIEVDAMGSPMRSKSFHDAYYGNMGDNGLPDQIATIKELGTRHRWLDLDRVGIWGHSGGGFAAADGILRYPDFYKVAVSQAGNHDQRTYEDDWGERYHGLLEKGPNGTTNYDDQANQNLVKNLKGKLLIAHGTMDDNVPPNNTMALVDALIKANKDFELITMTNRRHGFGNEPYMMRRRWDFFVKNLLGADPPKGYEIGAPKPPVP